MPSQSDCVFCKIVAGTIPSTRVFENDSTLAFLDIGPLAEGHLLVIPRDHYERIADVPSELFGAVASQAPMLGRALLEVTGAEGFNLLVNQGRAAGQVVPHVHFHLIPRKTDDGLGYRWNAGSYPAGRDAEIATALKHAVTKR